MVEVLEFFSRYAGIIIDQGMSGATLNLQNLMVVLDMEEVDDKKFMIEAIQQIFLGYKRAADVEREIKNEDK